MTRKTLVMALLGGILFAGAAEAKQPRCPLPVDVCLQQFELAKVRPWLGVEVDRDSATGVMTVVSVAPGGPAARAGVQAGDVLDRIDGRVPKDWFASKAGWKSSGTTPVAVVRNGRPQSLAVPVEPMSEELLARIVGTHMLEGHLAYMDHTHDDGAPHRH